MPMQRAPGSKPLSQQISDAALRFLHSKVGNDRQLWATELRRFGIDCSFLAAQREFTRISSAPPSDWPADMIEILKKMSSEAHTSRISCVELITNVYTLDELKATARWFNSVGPFCDALISDWETVTGNSNTLSILSVYFLHQKLVVMEDTNPLSAVSPHTITTADSNHQSRLAEPESFPTPVRQQNKMAQVIPTMGRFLRYSKKRKFGKAQTSSKKKEKFVPPDSPPILDTALLMQELHKILQSTSSCTAATSSNLLKYDEAPCTDMDEPPPNKFYHHQLLESRWSRDEEQAANAMLLCKAGARWTSEATKKSCSATGNDGSHRGVSQKDAKARKPGNSKTALRSDDRATKNEGALAMVSENRTEPSNFHELPWTGDEEHWKNIMISSKEGAEWTKAVLEKMNQIIEKTENDLCFTQSSATNENTSAAGVCRLTNDEDALAFQRRKCLRWSRDEEQAALNMLFCKAGADWTMKDSKKLCSVTGTERSHTGIIRKLARLGGNLGKDNRAAEITKEDVLQSEGTVEAEEKRSIHVQDMRSPWTIDEENLIRVIISCKEDLEWTRYDSKILCSLTGMERSHESTLQKIHQMHHVQNEVIETANRDDSSPQSTSASLNTLIEDGCMTNNGGSQKFHRFQNLKYRRWSRVEEQAAFAILLYKGGADWTIDDTQKLCRATGKERSHAGVLQKLAKLQTSLSTNHHPASDPL